MTLKMTIELSDTDLVYFRRVMDAVWRRNSKRNEKDLIAGARRLLQRAGAATAPGCVQARLTDLGVLLDMLEDPEWPLPDANRRRIVAAVSYFATPKDMIADAIPGIGYLDDALMAELVMRDLKHEVDGYREFCQYRRNEATFRGKTRVSKADWLAAKRRQIFLRIKRRQRETIRHASTEGPTDPILRYQY
ncbi:MAG TPA: YkvA family protein [Gammaproteobacteria bacterium]|nr:YkvA family protein [Gammaproteobacteria bacterium]